MKPSVYYDIHCDICHRSASIDYDQGFFNNGQKAIDWAHKNGWKTRNNRNVCPVCLAGLDLRKTEVSHTVRCPLCGKLGTRVSLTTVQHGDGTTCAHAPEQVWERPVSIEELKHHVWAQMTTKGDEAPVGLFIPNGYFCFVKVEGGVEVKRVRPDGSREGDAILGTIVLENERGAYALFPAKGLHIYLQFRG